MELKDIIKPISGLLGTALAGPLGGAAASFLADKLGLSEKTVEAVTEAISTGKLTPEQIASVKLAEIDFQKFIETHKLDMAKLDVENTQGARAMQVATRSFVPAALGLIITLGYLGILVGLMLGQLTVADNQVLLILIGALATGFGTVLNYYMGSSSGSQAKTELLAVSKPSN
jgi:hypothetical protein